MPLNDAVAQNAGVHFPPPLLFVGGFGAGWLIDRFFLALPLRAGSSAAYHGVGLLLVVLGVGLAAWGMLTFRRVGTAIVPNRPASQIVASGPYRFTRNPMYTGLSLVYLGGVALANSAWPLLLFPVGVLLFAANSEYTRGAHPGGLIVSGYRVEAR